ncbi:FAD-binding oxidoreductase [Cellulomonas soli]
MSHALSALVAGPVLTAADPGYAEEVAGFNTAFQHAPDVVVGATSTQDVVEAVRHARTHGLPVTVQSTGHGAHESIGGGVLISTARLDQVELDAASPTVTVGAGVRWSQVIDAAAPYGLAPISGSSPNVGVIGYLLGGGLGPLARSHGYSSDRLESATVVTGTGEVVEASADGDAELLWALRGGKHGLGVVTQARVRLAHVPALYAGNLTFAEEHIPAAVRGWLAWTREADPSVTTSVVVLHLPEVEQLLPHLRGARLATVHVAVPGDSATAERLVAPLRALAPVAADTVGPMALTDVGAIHGDPTEPGAELDAGRHARPGRRRARGRLARAGRSRRHAPVRGGRAAARGGCDVAGPARGVGRGGAPGALHGGGARHRPAAVRRDAAGRPVGLRRAGTVDRGGAQPELRGGGAGGVAARDRGAPGDRPPPDRPGRPLRPRPLTDREGIPPSRTGGDGIHLRTPPGRPAQVPQWSRDRGARRARRHPGTTTRDTVPPPDRWSTMLTELDTQVVGPVMSSVDPRLADEVAGFDATIAHTPDVVVGAVTTADVVAAVRWARAHRMPVAVQGTGHGTRTPVTSGLLITTWRLDQVRVDRQQGTATVGAGARWADVIDAAAPLGLMPVGATEPSVGVVGFLLGGGLGPFARSHGFSSDHVERCTVVTGTGELVEAGTGGDHELLWALRGGKHGLGVVTEMRLRLARVPSLYGGYLAFAGEHVPTVVRGWLAWTRQADPAVTTNLTIVHTREDGGFRTQPQARTLAVLFVARPGAADDGARATAPLRALAPAVIDTLAPMPLTDIAEMHGESMEPGPTWVRGAMLSGADQALAEAWLAHAGTADGHPFSGMQLRHVAGATALDVPEGSAVAGRGAQYTALLVGQDPALFAAMPEAADRILGALDPWLTAEVNPNFAGESGGVWPADVADRLAAVRRRVDPDGLFAPRL